LWAVGMSAVRKRERPTFIGREIPVARIRMAVAQALFYGLTLGAGVYALALVQPDGNFADQVFECASALGTVGLSRGITGTLNEAGKWVVVVLMFAGRVGPLGLGAVFFQPRESTPLPEEDVVM
jgi:trk system potassium uptake protein TrkH